MQRLTYFSLLSLFCLLSCNDDDDIRTPMESGSDSFTSVTCPAGIRASVCGTVQLPLDYDVPEGQTIDVGFAYYEPIAGSIAETAILIIHGGPGEPGSELLADLDVEAIRRNFPSRGLLTVDPRGIGLSTRLSCPELERAQTMYPDIDLIIQRCGEELGEKRVHYSTANTARDIDRVRLTLALDEFDILGFSYGTNLGSVYAGMFPSTVRTLTLDGAYPTSNYELFQPNYMAALRRKFAIFCERSGECTSEEVLDALAFVTSELRDSPRQLPVPDDLDPALLPENPILDVSMLAALAAQLPQETEDGDGLVVPVIGALLDARNNVDFSSLEAMALEVYLERGLIFTGEEEVFQRIREVTALMLAVDCPESNVPWSLDASIPERRAQLISIGQSVSPNLFFPFDPLEWVSRPQNQNYYPFCINWPAPPRGKSPERRIEFDDWRDDLPVLVLAGDYDMQTPLEDARQAAAQYNMATFARFKHKGHVIIPDSPCAFTQWVNFVQTGTADANQCFDAEPVEVLIR